MHTNKLQGFHLQHFLTKACNQITKLQNAIIKQGQKQNQFREMQKQKKKEKEWTLKSGVGKGSIRQGRLRHIINLVQWSIGTLRRHSSSESISLLHSFLLGKPQPPSYTPIIISLWRTRPHSIKIFASDHCHTTHATIPTRLSRRKKWQWQERIRG